MYRDINRNRSSSSYDHLIKFNFAIVAILTITTTALTAYLINVLVQTQIKTSRNITHPISSKLLAQEFPILRHEQHKNLKKKEQSPKLAPPDPETLTRRLNYDDQILWNNTLGSPRDWQPDEEASEPLETKVRPDHDLTSGFVSFKQRLAAMSKKDLLALLKILQERIERAAVLIKKRNAESSQQQLQKQESKQVAQNNKFVFKDNGVVIRSEKMDRLMGYLERIESKSPNLDQQKLKKLAALNEGKSPIKIIKPSVMDAILRPESMQVKLRRQVESVAPEEGWAPPQPSAEAEDWPEVTTAKPKKKKKKKKKIVPVSTTTTTTPAPVPVQPETSPIPASPAPPTATEEVWIEEEEDIFRPPPRKKTKKYKKKTLPPSTTTTTTQAPTTTTTTTTTTTPAPATSTIAPTTPAVVIEDWPQEHWGKKGQGSTQAPWPETQDEEAGKWPEEEWLNFVRNHVQDQLNIIYV